MIRTSRSPLAACLLTLCITACGAAESEPSSPHGGPEGHTSASASEDRPASAGCAAASDCTACLVIDGCNWTAGECANECFMDTYCVGPGNPGATTCMHSVVILGAWHEDHAAAEDGVRTFVPDSVELGLARFRRSMTFVDAGETTPALFRTNVLAPNDAHSDAEGTWSVEGDRLTVRYRTAGSADETVERYDIVESGAQRLRLRPVTP